MQNIPQNWDVTPREAIEQQKILREQIVLTPLTKPIHYVGGADVSMNIFAKNGFAGFVTLSYPELQLVDHAVVESEIKFPYIPWLLSFREIPILLLAWEKLETKPDVIIVDGVGIAHPRRLGIATHLGLILNVTTIGCSKNLLTGKYAELSDEPGSIEYIRDNWTDEIIGAAIRTKKKVKPVFVSPGHLITLEESIEIVENCVLKYRLPQTTRYAHNTVNEYRVRSLSQSPLF